MQFNSKLKTNYLKGVLIFTLIFFVLIINYLSIDCKNFIGILVLIVDIYSIIRYKKNNMLLFVFLALTYFDYSFLISKYLSTTSNLTSVYEQLKYSNSLMISVSLVFIFHLILLLFIDSKKCINSDNTYVFNEIVNNSKKYILVLTLITAAIIIVLFDYFFLHLLSFSRAMYEYLLIFFVFGFYYSKKTNNKLFRNILFIIMLISTAINMYEGARIISLQPIIAYFFIWYENKIDSKKIFLVFVIGIIVFTAFGLYGDYLDYGLDISNLNSKVIIDTFLDRKFSLDTSISSYWTGLTYIELTNIIPFSDRISNFIQYITIYALKGTSSSYEQLYFLSRKYYVHYYGGYITSYFYYWFGWFGVFIIGLYIGKLMKLTSKLNPSSSDFQKLLVIYFVATLPRWYLYYPVTLFRGMLIFIIIYVIFNILLGNKANNSERKTQ